MSNMEVLATCINGEEAVTAAKTLAPDLILMDAVMPTMNGVEATRLIKSINEEIKILMLTTFSDKELIFNAFEAGVDGYLLKDITSEKLMISMKEVMEGSFIIPSDIAKKLVKQVSIVEYQKYEHFNQTEKEIVKLLKEGMTNKEISQTLNISYGTTRNYISDIYKKLGGTDRKKLWKS